MAEIPEDRKSIFKKWLETLQQESWQLELLISGLALFGVFGSKVLIDDLDAYLKLQFFSSTVRMGVYLFIFLIKGSWYIFLINLVIHIILRGLWIGAIGLRYVSEDIDYEQLNFSSYFKKLYTKRYESFDDYIEELEKICSVIFAYTFLLFFILLSAGLFIAWPVVLISFLGQVVGPLFGLFYILFGLIVFVDFITLNPLKKVKDRWFNIIYGFLFRFFSTITLSFIFRPLLLNFLDNKFTKRLFLFSIPYGAVIILLLPNIESESFGYFPEFGSNGLKSRGYQSQAIDPYLYDDLIPDKNHGINYVILSEHKYEGSIMEFFVEHFRSDEEYFQKEKGLGKINRKGIYTGFRNNEVVDSNLILMKLEQERAYSDFFKEKRDSTNAKTEHEWDSVFNDMETQFDFKEYEYHQEKMVNLNKSFQELCKFYIDDVDISGEVDCLISKHSKVGSKGWRCYTPLDSLSNGMHRLRVVRSFYQSKNQLLSPRVIEIPFILDRN